MDACSRAGRVIYKQLEVKTLRNQALLLFRLHTRHRLQEIAALRWDNLRLHAPDVSICWHQHGQHQSFVEPLMPVVSEALLRYLHALHGSALVALPPDTPVWMCFRRNQGEMLSTRAIAELYQAIPARIPLPDATAADRN